jgi:TRAP-type mannitol/chloroaromatic compound transport system permease large subunit
VVIVGTLLAASTGIVGATVVTMGLLCLPTMLKRGYDPQIATGVICASGTLGQIIPPSIILVLLGDVISSAYSQAQLKMGNYSPDTISVGDLFVGALIPGLILVGLYVLYIAGVAIWQPARMPAIPLAERQLARSSGFALRLLKALVAPLVLILAVLGSILAGVATPTEAAARRRGRRARHGAGQTRTFAVAPARDHVGHRADEQHGVHDPDRCVGVLTGVPRARRRRRRA